MAVISFITITSFVFIALPVLPAEAQIGRRRKIGLVLGGGGALGGAHLGVLKVLEENNIPVDYIAGTSMGSIIGGAYAGGMSPDEIEDLLNSIDWKNFFNDKPSRDYIPFRDKYDTRRLANFEVGFSDKQLKLPRGAVAGQKLDFLLEQLTVQLGVSDDFDKLQIPYRAVATDLETGESVTLSKGKLSQAIRASMSVPGAFSPVEIDGRILADGMVAKNVPVDVVQEMGADVIICVDVGGARPGRDRLDSNIAIIMQMIGIFTTQNVEYQKSLLDSDDIFIQANPGQGITAADFNRLMETIDAGERIARQHVDQLKRLSVSDEEYEKFLAKQRSTFKDVKIDFVKVGSTGRAHPKQVESKVRTKPGKEIDFKTLKGDLSRIYAIGDFENVDFNIVEEKTGQKGLLIEGKEKSWGPHYLMFGLNIAENFRGDSYYSVMMQHQWRQINSLGADWKNRFSMGRDLSYKSLFYQPLDHSERFFVQPLLKIGQEYVDIYREHEQITEYETQEVFGAFEGGINFGNVAQARGGLFWRYLSAKPHIKRFNIPEFEGLFETGIHGNITFDSMDNANFPRHGTLASADIYMPLEALGSDEDYRKFEFRFSKPVSYKNHTLLLATRGGGNLGDHTPFYNSFTIGGFPTLAGYKNDELRGQYYTSSNLLYYYKVIDMPNIWAGGIYIGGGLEAGNTWNNSKDIEFDDIFIGGKAFLGIDTFIGPVYAGYGITEQGTDTGEFFLYVGRQF
jgi:NTE family protein